MLRKIISERINIKRKLGDYMDNLWGDGSSEGAIDISNVISNITKSVDTQKGVYGSEKNWGSTSDQQKKSKAAWNYLRPFLPKGAVLTSVFRSQDHQDSIIRKYAKKKGYSGPEDLDKMHAYTKSKGLEIARHVGRGHGGKGGTCAFDISGANLNDIYGAVEFVSNHPQLSKFAKFAKTGLGKGRSSIIERENNAVHVHFNLSDIKTPYDPSFADDLVEEAQASKDKEKES
jgi:hypothetical protein